MKIAILGTFLGQKTSGAEISSFLLSQSLSKKEDVFIVTTKITQKMPCKAYSLGLTQYLPHNVLMVGTNLTDYYMYRKILRIFKNEKPDLVHIQDFSIMIPSLNAAKKLGIPTVMTVRDFRFECNLDTCSEQGKLIYRCNKKAYSNCLKKTFSTRKLLKLIWPVFLNHFFKRKLKLNKYAKKVDNFVSVSDFVKSTLVKFGINKARIHTIFVPKPDWKNIEKLKSKKSIILFSAGLLAKAKGFQTIIEAFGIISNKYEKVVLRIAGTGSYEKELKKLVKKLNLTNKINFLGKISCNDMKKEYFNSDIVLQASIRPEPLSRIIFESFSARKPIVVTDSGGSKELVKDGKTGFVVNINDSDGMAKKIEILIKDPKLRKKMGSEGFKFITKHCNMKKVYENHMNVYRGLVNEKKK